MAVEEFRPDTPLMVVTGVLPVGDSAACVKCRITVLVLEVMTLAFILDAYDLVEFDTHERVDFMIPEFYEIPYTLQKIELIQATVVGNDLIYTPIYEAEVDTEIPQGAPTLIMYQRERFKFDDTETLPETNS